MLISLRRKYEDQLIQQDLRSSAIIPVMAFAESQHLFLTDDKCVGMVFECTPMYGADEKVQERVNGFLNQEYPVNTVIGISLFRSPDIVPLTNRMLMMRDRHRHPVFTPVIQERANYLLRHSHEKLISNNHLGYYDSGFVQDLKLFISVKVPIARTQPSKEELRELIDLRTKVEASLQSIGLGPVKMTADSYVRALSTMLNWGENAAWRSGTRWEDDKPISQQVFDYDTDIEINKDGLRLGNQHVRMLSAKRLPEAMYFGDAIAYAGNLTGGHSILNENYMVTCNITFPPTEKSKQQIHRKRQFTVNQAYGPLLKFVPILADKKNAFDLMYDSMNEGFRPVKISYSVALFAPSKERADAAVISARAFWREQRFELMPDRFVTLPMFINTLPLCADTAAIRDTFRYKTMTAEHAAPIIPIFGEWKGTGTPHAVLMSRNGQAMSLSLHDSDTNMNLCICAESGSGKSFLANELIFSYLSEGAQIWVIDVGRSYEKLAELLKGDFVAFDDASAVGLNPFPLVRDYDEEEDGLFGLVCAMASAAGTLSDWQEARLKKVMGECWRDYGNEMSIDHIAERCLADEDRRLKDVGDLLYVFTSKGSYGKFFSGMPNINFKNDFTVLELDDLQGRTHLRQVVLLQLIYQIQQEVFLGERNRKKIVIVDEAWDLLKEGSVAVFMEHAYRKFRKYGGSVVICTQSVNDLYENEAGRPIIENSSSLYLLGQKSETVEAVKREGRLVLSEGGFHMLKTVRTIPGVYSEIFVKARSGWGIGRLIVGEFQKLLYSTKAEDVDDIRRYVQVGMSVPDAINQVLADRGLSNEHNQIKQEQSA